MHRKEIEFPVTWFKQTRTHMFFLITLYLKYENTNGTRAYKTKYRISSVKEKVSRRSRLMGPSSTEKTRRLPFCRNLVIVDG